MPTVLDIGNCDADHMFLESMFQSNFGATLLRAHRLDDAQDKIKGNTVDLILINRLLDTDGSEGMDVLRKLKSDPESQNIPAMIITNYEEHQEAAMDEGAVRGFGKSALRSEETRKVIDEVLNSVT